MSSVPADAKWIDVDGIKTRYIDQGQGAPIVLVHGGAMGDLNAASSLDDWRLNIDGLSQSHRVIAVDRLGQGYTANPSREQDWSLRGSTEHLKGFLKAIDVGPCHLVGHSEGGYTVCRLAVEAPSLVASCVIVDSYTTATGSSRDEYFAALNPHQAGTRASAKAQYEFYSCSPEHIGSDWLDVNEALFSSEQNQAARQAMNGDGLKSTIYLNNLLFDREQLLSRLAAQGVARPILVVWGYDDPVASVDQSYHLYRILSQHQQRSHLHILNQAGHYSFRERSAEFDRIVNEFVDGAFDGN
ncbi:MAG: 2-hydroxy-6-oxonona-2,4-dienedioate hydrolase [Alphaproteobacteria bacterium]|jgi:pimeloyl-ACP methyl ester carboxylesterase|nr:2-hydroxy-6-oxonona-2,4-dienedioate hydrolase [Alphaproteobacteria bacterium]